MTQAFGEAFEQLRIARNLSAAELARELDEYEGNVSRWRRGGGIDVTNVRKIADYFGVNRGWLEGLAGYPPSTTTDAPVDPRLAALMSSIESSWVTMDEAARDLAERTARALFATQPVAANTSDAPTATPPGARSNGRRRRLLPPLESHQGRGVLAYASSLMLSIWHPRRGFAMPAAATA